MWHHKRMIFRRVHNGACMRYKDELQSSLAGYRDKEYCHRIALGWISFRLCNTTPSYWPLVCIYLNTSNKKQTYDRHSLAYVVEVKNGEQTVSDGSAHLCGGDGSGSARAKHKTKVSGRSHKSALIWRLSLVNQLAWQEIKRKTNSEPSDLCDPLTRHPPRLPLAHPHSSPHSWRCGRATEGGKTRGRGRPQPSPTPAGCRRRNRSLDLPEGWRQWSPISGGKPMVNQRYLPGACA